MNRFFRPVVAAILLLFALAPAFAGEPLKVAVSSSHSSKGSNSAGDAYIEAVRKAGHVPFILPLVRTAEQAQAQLEPFDALLLTGGEDVDPRWYCEESIGDCVKVNAARDTSDILYIREAMARGLKILAICRGSQILNVALGGSLVQDIPSQVQTNLIHKQKEPSTDPTHMVSVAKGSLVERLMGADHLMVNSLHHQAVKAIAPGLKVILVAPDGVIEGYEGRNILAVQFHPERLIEGGDTRFVALFKFEY